jgi:hypothetical protein
MAARGATETDDLLHDADIVQQLVILPRRISLGPVTHVY